MHIKQERSCIACRTKKNQQELTRIAKCGNEYVIDKYNKLEGRGAYICKNKKCVDLVIKKKLLNRAFKTSVDATVYSQLEENE